MGTGKAGILVEKPSKHDSSQVLKVKTKSDIMLTACTLDTMRENSALSSEVFLPKIHIPSNHEKNIMEIPTEGHSTKQPDQQSSNMSRA